MASFTFLSSAVGLLCGIKTGPRSFQQVFDAWLGEQLRRAGSAQSGQPGITLP